MFDHELTNEQKAMLRRRFREDAQAAHIAFRVPPTAPWPFEEAPEDPSFTEWLIGFRDGVLSLLRSTQRQPASKAPDSPIPPRRHIRPEDMEWM